MMNSIHISPNDISRRLDREHRCLLGGGRVMVAKEGGEQLSRIPPPDELITETRKMATLMLT